MKKIFYLKDAVDLYNNYYEKNNKDISGTLMELVADRKLPIYFMHYFPTHKEFIDRFGITEEQFDEAGCSPWSGFEVFRPKGL